MEVRPLGRADEALQKAHGPEAVPLPQVPALVQPLGPPLAAHEAALTRRALEQFVKTSSRDVDNSVNTSLAAQKLFTFSYS